MPVVDLGLAPDAVRRALAEAASGALRPAELERSLGVPVGANKDVMLPGVLSDASWDVLVSTMRATFNAHGKEIRTVEGLADGRRMHPLQRAFMAHHGLQCGFCTPGFLMLATNALERNPDMNAAEQREMLSSNLCRCTGYQNILKAVSAAAAKMR